MSEQNTVGLSAETHEHLRRLKEDCHFEDMRDAYRFAIALALSRDQIAKALNERQTIYNIGTLDPDGRLSTIVAALLPTESVLKTIELLAEWGVQELHRLTASGEISFAALLDEITRNGS